jgi:hypothetical protein
VTYGDERGVTFRLRNAPADACFVTSMYRSIASA